MAQVELHFHKKDATPWGFRLTGGTDFEVPLQVVKVTRDSLADKVGMRVGDYIVRINNTDTADLTHIQAHDVILDAGTDFTMTVIRGQIAEEQQEVNITSLNVNINDYNKQRMYEESMESETRQHEMESHTVSGKMETNIELSVQIHEEEYLTTEEVEPEISHQTIISGGANVTGGAYIDDTTKSKIAEIIGAESKVLPQGGFGVDFNKIMPSVDFIKDSEVLKVLNEATAKKEEIKTTDRKWSSFLQKPRGPKPKDKKREAEERNKNKEPPYRVVIVKGKKKEQQQQRIDSQQASQGSSPSVEHAATPDTLDSRETQEPVEQAQEQQDEDENNEQSEQNEQDSEDELTEPVVNEVEMSLEEQLAAVQSQLLALSQLPAAIQQTLDVVTAQLAKIVGPTASSANGTAGEDASDRSQNEDDDQNIDDEFQQDDYENELDILDEIPEEGESDQEAYQTSDPGREEGHEEGQEEMSKRTPESVRTPEPELTEEEREARRIAQEKEDKKVKDHQLLEELRQRRIKERPAFPLTPLQRPIFLPGGRRWKMPGDACPEIVHPDMSDDTIAETISSQSEIITGTTLGINFLKYQPVAKPLDHLKNSEVYKLVHDLEPAPRGIPARAGKALAAEEDYYTQIRKEAPQQHDALNK